MQTKIFKICLAATIIVADISYLSTPAWGQTVLFNRRINSDSTAQIVNEEQIAVNSTNPDNLVAVWRDFRVGYRQVGVGYSTSAGDSWSDRLIGWMLNPFDWESDPGVTVDRDGNFYVVTLCFNPEDTLSAICLYKSTDGGANWAGPLAVVQNQALEDKELITCDQTGGTHDGNLYISWTRYGNYLGLLIFFSSSSDGGTNWTAPKKISADTTYSQWSVPAVGANGEVYLAWVQVNKFGSYPSLVFCKSTDGGNSFSTPKDILPVAEWNTFLKGDIWVFSYPALATDISNSPHRGNLYLAYMDTSSWGDEDIFFVRSTDQGQSWSTPIRLNDDLPNNGADQFHPWVVVNQDGVISVIFYDRRNDSANLSFDVYFTQSYDGGKNFTANKRITTVSSYPYPIPAKLFTNIANQPSTKMQAAHYPFPSLAASPLAGLLGEYIGIASSGSQNYAVWTDTREGLQNVYNASVITKLLRPKLLSPANSSYISDNTPALVWQDFSYYDTVSFYRLQYSQDYNFSLGVKTIDWITDTSFTLPDSLALAETTYYWRVQSFNSRGDSSGYQDHPFSFGADVTVPLVPVLIAPLDTSGDPTPFFRWNPVSVSKSFENYNPHVASPVRYSWQLAQDTAFTVNLISLTELVNPSYQLPDSLALDTGQTYFWRVQAYDGAGNQSGFTPPTKFDLWGYLPGDATGDKILNLSDVVYIINYIFKNGPVPKINSLSGDTNCNGTITLVDVIYLINFIFRRYPLPCS